jgi:hypothetical protein
VDRPVPAELHEFLSPFPPEVAETALALRDRVLAVVPEAHETVWDATNAVSIVHGASERWRDDAITHVAVYARHVNLGFNQGAQLPDPAEVLAGSGAHIRHVTFRSSDEVALAEWIDGYVEAALVEAGLDGSMGDRGTTVRRSNGVKRRPG